MMGPYLELGSCPATPTAWIRRVGAVRWATSGRPPGPRQGGGLRRDAATPVLAMFYDAGLD